MSTPFVSAFYHSEAQINSKPPERLPMTAALRDAYGQGGLPAGASGVLEHALPDTYIDTINIPAGARRRLRE
jgi:hypothetical protein